MANALDPNRSLLDRIAARVSDWGELDGPSWAMATMISPNRAVAVLRDATPRRLEVILPRQPYESTAVEMLTYDAELGFVILGLRKEFHSLSDIEISGTVPAVGPCLSLLFNPEQPDGDFVEGTISYDGPRPFVMFHTKPKVALGAPIVTGGKLVGIVGQESMIEMSLLRSLPAGVVAGFTSPKLLDFRALDAGATAVVDSAAGMAMATDRSTLHMEYLLLALAGAGHIEVSYDELRNALAKSAEIPRGGFASAKRGSKHVAMPRLSGHVDAAMTNAILVAAARGATRLAPSDLLDGILQLENCGAVDAARSLGVVPTAKLEAVPLAIPDSAPVIAGYLSDAATADNSLGFGKQAYDLCTVLAAKAVKPPVSVGLFGDWGAGKSSFMKLMEAQFKRIEQSANLNPNSAFCKRIVHLWFNAWHYVDDNLYAGIAREIFEGLGFALAANEKQATAEELAFQRRAAEQEEKTALENWQAAVVTSAQREREFQRTQQTIEQLNIDPKALENAMTPADVIVEVTSFASGNAEVKSTIEKAADRIRYPRDEAGDLLANVHGTMDALRELLKVPKNLAGSTIWVLLGLGAILAGLTYKALAYVGGVALISWATWIAAAARAAARFVADARKREQEIVEARKTRLKTELDRQALALKNAKDDEASKEQTLTAARAQSLAVQPELRMTNFVRERLAAWQKDAGVIAAAHRDFRELSRFLQRVVSTPAVADGKPAPVPIDRIVLYIDDLDRCPEDKVFQVLQAVHLLLAFDLFVVIVAVDSSWLLESVKTFSKRTPQNYLEKIFQIPYTLDPMPVERFGDFVKSLTSTLATPERSEAATPKLVIDGAPPGSIPESRLVNTPADATKPDETIRLEAAKSNEPPVDPAPEHLTFEEHEVNFTTALFPFMSSPRNTKRFVNVYRLLRATLEPAELAAFRDAKTDAHKPAQFLIAIITNQHEIAPDFCARLRAAKPGSNWESFCNSFFEEDTPHGKAIRALHKSDHAFAGRKMKEFQDWLPRVARYSFEMGRLVTDAT